jgi:hypothetical protein
MAIAFRVNDQGCLLGIAQAEAFLRVELGLLGGVYLEDHTPNFVPRLTGEERVAFAGPVVAPLVKTERVV